MTRCANTRSRPSNRKSSLALFFLGSFVLFVLLPVFIPRVVHAAETNVFLELTHPAGPSPAVFTDGWVFGARCFYVRQPEGTQADCSDSVAWSGSGDFFPGTGRISRPKFELPGPNNITLSVVIEGVRHEQHFPVLAVLSAGYAKLGDPLECLQTMATAALTPGVTLGTIVTGSPNVTINGVPAARQGDEGVMSGIAGPHARIEMGDHNVLIDGRPAARWGDKILCALGHGSIGRMTISEPMGMPPFGADELTKCAGASAQVEAARGYVQRGDILRGDIETARNLLNSARAAGCRELNPEIAAVAAAANAAMQATRQDTEAAIASCDPKQIAIVRAKLRDAPAGTFDGEIAKLDRVIGPVAHAIGEIETATSMRDRGVYLDTAKSIFKKAREILAGVNDVVRCNDLERQIAEGIADIEQAEDLAKEADTALRTCNLDRMRAMLTRLEGNTSAAIAGKERRIKAAVNTVERADANFLLFQKHMTAGEFTAAWAAVTKSRRAVVFLDGADCEERIDRFTDAIRVVQEHYYAERDAKLALQSCYLYELETAKWNLERLAHPTTKPLQARVDAAITVAKEYRAAIEATRAENNDEADRLMQSTNALLDSIDESDCQWIREDLSKAKSEDTGEVVAVVHFVIKIKGSGYIPHWAGGSWSTAGYNEEVFTLKRGTDLKTELKAYCERLVGNPEEMVNPPGVPGLVKRPIFWNEGPEIEVTSDKIFTFTQARTKAVFDTWVVDQGSNHGPLSELKKRYKKRGCRIKSK